jgi:hypothetical protein
MHMPETKYWNQEISLAPHMILVLTQPEPFELHFSLIKFSQTIKF